MNKQYIQTLLDETIHAVSVSYQILSEPGGPPPSRYSGPEMIKFIQDGDPGDSTLRQHLNNGMWTGKTYTYLTRLNLKPGALVAVMARGELKIALVVEFHEVPQIEENSNIDYQWVIQEIDLIKHNEFLLENEQTLAKITKVGREHHRNMARLAILSAYPELAPPQPETKDI